jgi:hypothetical protein
MALLYNDPEYFKNVLFILDGDKDISSTKYKDLPNRYHNVLFLPGNDGPESLLYTYLSTLPPTHDILSDYFEKGLSLRGFKEMNPLTNSLYQNYSKDREKYKHWFIDNQAMFDDINLMKYWIEDHTCEYQEFKKSFKDKFNIVAGRTRIPKLN